MSAGGPLGSIPGHRDAVHRTRRTAVRGRGGARRARARSALLHRIGVPLEGGGDRRDARALECCAGLRRERPACHLSALDRQEGDQPADGQHGGPLHRDRPGSGRRSHRGMAPRALGRDRLGRDPVGAVLFAEKVGVSRATVAVLPLNMAVTGVRRAGSG